MDHDRQMPRRRPVRALAIAGTRPEAIKLAPLKQAAAWSPDVALMLVGTGQHAALFTDALAPFGIVPDAMLAAGQAGQTIDALAAAIHALMPALLATHPPDVVIVQGDTTTAWAAARAAHAAGVPVAHVEAGLRSGDPLLPWPEERNRIEIDRIADLLFAPNDRAATNLRAEGVPGHIHVTGNSGIDALMTLAGALPAPVREPGARRRIIVTCHRRENHGAAMGGIAAALRRLAARPDVAITVTRHPNPAAGAALEALLDRAAGIRMVDPLSYPAMLAALKEADLVLSDSGGLQEECPALGVPLLVLRANSERPEAIEGGHALLVGAEPDRIVAAAERLLDDPAAHAAMARPGFPFGDGRASARILGILASHPFPLA